MIRSMYTSATGMQAQTTNIDVIANNLANVNTSGFKKSRADFQDLLYDTLQAPGAASSGGTQFPTGLQIGHGVRTVAVSKIFSAGEYQNTKNELDWALTGDGFFQILRPDGSIGYTRAGSFKLDSDGRIVTPDGFPLEPEMTIPSDAINVTVGVDGTVSVLQAGDVSPVELGTVELARFPNPAGLTATGKNMFLQSLASGDALIGTAGQNGFGYIDQGFVEMSNVSVVDEMVNMITAQRAYEVNSKVIQTADDMLQIANNVKR